MPPRRATPRRIQPSRSCKQKVSPTVSTPSTGTRVPGKKAPGRPKTNLGTTSTTAKAPTKKPTAPAPSTKKTPAPPPPPPPPTKKPKAPVTPVHQITHPHFIGQPGLGAQKTQKTATPVAPVAPITQITDPNVFGRPVPVVPPGASRPLVGLDPGLGRPPFFQRPVAVDPTGTMPPAPPPGQLGVPDVETPLLTVGGLMWAVKRLTVGLGLFLALVGLINFETTTRGERSLAAPAVCVLGRCWDGDWDFCHVHESADRAPVYIEDFVNVTVSLYDATIDGLSGHNYNLVIDDYWRFLGESVLPRPPGLDEHEVNRAQDNTFAFRTGLEAWSWRKVEWSKKIMDMGKEVQKFVDGLCNTKILWRQILGLRYASVDRAIAGFLVPLLNRHVELTESMLNEAMRMRQLSRGLGTSLSRAEDLITQIKHEAVHGPARPAPSAPTGWTRFWHTLTRYGAQQIPAKWTEDPEHTVLFKAADRHGVLDSYYTPDRIVWQAEENFHALQQHLEALRDRTAALRDRLHRVAKGHPLPARWAVGPPPRCGPMRAALARNSEWQDQRDAELQEQWRGRPRRLGQESDSQERLVADGWSRAVVGGYGLKGTRDLCRTPDSQVYSAYRKLRAEARCDGEEPAPQGRGAGPDEAAPRYNEPRTWTIYGGDGGLPFTVTTTVTEPNKLTKGQTVTGSGSAVVTGRRGDSSTGGSKASPR